jgi:hypothetical protein
MSVVEWRWQADRQAADSLAPTRGMIVAGAGLPAETLPARPPANQVWPRRERASGARSDN